MILTAAQTSQNRSTRLTRLKKHAIALVACLPALIGTNTAWADPPARVIVKYRTGSTLLANTPDKRAHALGARVQSDISSIRELRPRVQLVQARGLSAEALAERLAAQTDVEYAVPDRIKRIRTIPNDLHYASQWYLQAAQPAAINTQDAWDMAQGKSNTIIAVLDTGIRPEHPDFAGKLVGGYDFVSDPDIAGDGQTTGSSERDDDPSDPGDFVSAEDFKLPIFHNQDCGAGKNKPTTSSWHGTQVAGIVGAATNNVEGIAGVAWNAKIEPVRVLGKCGGYDSDIIDGMRWAAGLSVSGVPDNPNPAQILNLSLGGEGSCSPAYRDVINEILAKGVLIVAAAGNGAGTVDEPANCDGVLAVAGVRHTGTKVGYSNYGRQVGIAAPSGNCENSSGDCLFPIISTTNTGTTTPGASSYTDSTNFAVGTSFAAPQAAGVAALMLSVNSGLTPAQLIQHIKSSATPFPADPTLRTCPIIDLSGQCNCTTLTCGAGMLNAQKAVLAALQPSAQIVASANTLDVSETLTLDGSSSAVADERHIASYAWRITSGGGTGSTLSAPDQPVTILMASAAGSVSLSLTVTDDAGYSNTTSKTLAVTGSSGGTNNQSNAPSSNTPMATATAGDSGGGGGAVDPFGLLLLILLAGIAYAIRSERQAR
ncbi:MAG: S8 family peptidase [Betaproteobacteria bacterium]|nr:S8 family peptidase [Betaproteobacteria bacterium]